MSTKIKFSFLASFLYCSVVYTGISFGTECWDPFKWTNSYLPGIGWISGTFLVGIGMYGIIHLHESYMDL